MGESLTKSGNKSKYFSDFSSFVFESSIEDFCDTQGADVIVSTIHKAKGKEYDDVYLLLTDKYRKDDSLIRRYYVGMTRAKNRLFIHTNIDYFAGLGEDEYVIDNNQYMMPKEIVLQQSMRDVYLDFFVDRKREVLSLMGGDALNFIDGVLYNVKTNRPVSKLSRSMEASLTEWEERGYRVISSQVRFVVAWRPKDAPKEETERAVLLADLNLLREEKG